MNRAVKNSATPTRFAPMELKPLSNPPAMSDPASPPAGTASRTAGKCHSDSSDGSESNMSV